MESHTPSSSATPSLAPGAVPPSTGLPLNRWVVGVAALLVGGAIAAAIVASPRLQTPSDAATGAAGTNGAKPVAAPQRAAAAPAATPAPAASVCATCGTVESVTVVQRKGEGTGLGAVAGGVLGGVVGHQFGGGSGKTAMTVLGAVGGGVAGHEVEKRARATTAYQVRVRMDDGTTRTVTQAQNQAVGARVSITPEGLKPLAAGS